MSDVNILYKAAENAGYLSLATKQGREVDQSPSGALLFHGAGVERATWNPLLDDGDAFRLAVDMRMEIDVWKNDIFVRWNGLELSEHWTFSSDQYAITRRLIVECAAQADK